MTVANLVRITDKENFPTLEMHFTSVFLSK